MKTFTVTFHRSNNYGAVLQAYALQNVIKELGHDNTIFDYIFYKGFYNRIKFTSIKTFFRSVVGNVLKFFRRKELKQLDKEFRRFHNERMKLSETVYTLDSIKKNPPAADCYITGSDQVWNLNSRKVEIPIRFLDFGEASIKRISYAASIEKTNYTDSQKQEVREYLNEFSAISLREEDAKTYISDIIGKKCERTIDPIFLLEIDEWKRIARMPRVDEPYILCYQVQSNSKLKKVAKHLKKKTGYKVVAISNTEIKYFNADYTFFDVSPEEFLGFYLNAEIVVSASFHGTAFGILFEKPTYGVARKTGSSRIKEILSLFEMEEYYIRDTDNIPEFKCDFKKQRELLNSERKKSINFLKEQLGDGNKN